MSCQSRRWVGLQATFFLGFTVAFAPVSVADTVVDWNATSMDVLLASATLGIVQSRPVAMVPVAVHDALNTINRRFQRYAVDFPLSPDASPDAAVAAAARGVLIALYPAQGEMIEAAYAATLDGIPEGEPKVLGIDLGASVAQFILDLRSDDGSSDTTPYIPGEGPGEWQPTPPAFGPAVLPHWRYVTPFAVKSSSQFRAPGPPSLFSVRYASDLIESYNLGALNSATRTPEQSEIAQFWYEYSHFTWNQIGRIVSAQRGLDMWQNARLFALLGLGGADGYISGWDSKYEFRFWRPVTAIGFATDPGWLPFLNTPAHPDYVSTHSVFGGVSSTILSRFFGGDAATFTLTTSSAPVGVYRSFTSFSQAAEENRDSRVYAGIHFRTACEDGVALGQGVGNYVMDHFLLPLR